MRRRLTVDLGETDTTALERIRRTLGEKYDAEVVRQLIREKYVQLLNEGSK
jgi:hypothetical protein